MVRLLRVTLPELQMSTNIFPPTKGNGNHRISIPWQRVLISIYDVTIGCFVQYVVSIRLLKLLTNHIDKFYKMQFNRQLPTYHCTRNLKGKPFYTIFVIKSITI